MTTIPLSPAQSDFMTAGEYWPGFADNPRFSLVKACDVIGTPGADLLNRCVERLLQDNSNLLCSFRRAGGGWVQVRHERDEGARLVVTDLRSDDVESSLRSAGEQLARQKLEVFDEAPGGCVFHLIRVGDDRYLVAVVAHHLVVDGTGVAKLMDDLWQLYEHPERLDEPVDDAHDPWVEYCRRLAADADDPMLRERSVAYWRDFYEAHPATLVPTDTAGRTAEENIVDLASVRIDEQLQIQLSEQSRRHGVSPVSILLTGALHMVSEVSGSPTSRLYNLQSGRGTRLGRACSGPTFSLFPVGATFGPEVAANEQVKGVQHQILLANRYNASPLTRRWEWLDYVDFEHLGPGPAVLPFFQSMSVERSQRRPIADLSVVNLSSAEFQVGNWKSPGLEVLGLLGDGEPGVLAARYDRFRFERPTVDRLLGLVYAGVEQVIDSLTRDVAVGAAR